MTDAEQLAALKARHKKRVERRGKYLATLSPAQRRERDAYVHWTRQWREHYLDLVSKIMTNKAFIRAEGHNDLKALRARRMILQQQRFEAHAMLLSRELYKARFSSSVIRPTEV